MTGHPTASGLDGTYRVQSSITPWDVSLHRGEVTEETRTIHRRRQSSTEIDTASTGYVSNYLGQIEQLTYPDGETVTYGYDAGGNVKFLKGSHYGHTFLYVTDIGYNEQGQRAFIEYGTGVRTFYEYDENRRWLSSIETSKDGSQYQNISYEFDSVGNVLGYTNDCASYGNYSTSQSYSYDALYQLTHAEGSTIYTPYKGVKPVHTSRYTQDFSFDVLGNMTEKVSTNRIEPSQLKLGDDLNYSFAYSYAEGFAHRLDHIGNRYYKYDACGNIVLEGGADAESGKPDGTGDKDDDWVWDDESVGGGIGGGSLSGSGSSGNNDDDDWEWDDDTVGGGIGGGSLSGGGTSGNNDDDDWEWDDDTVGGGIGGGSLSGSGTSGNNDDDDDWVWDDDPVDNGNGGSSQSGSGIAGNNDDDWIWDDDPVNSGNGSSGDVSEEIGNTTVISSYDWNERNQMVRSINGSTEAWYVYGADGQRTNKYTSSSETVYFSRFWAWRGDASFTPQNIKNIYLGESRLVTKINGEVGHDSYSEELHKTYYYHSDHLGSAQLITDWQGMEYQRIEYTPYGETWVEKTENTYEYLPYKFTGKELDDETGLYYYGARYLDAKYSRWISTDPALGEYMSGYDIGCGGVYNSINLNLYHYANNNPIKYNDPTGMWVPDADGNLIAEEGDGITSLAKFQNITYNEAKEQLLSQGYKIKDDYLDLKVGDKVTMNNVYTKSIADSINPDLTTERYIKNEIGELEYYLSPQDYNCWGAAITGSQGKDIKEGVGIKKTEVFDSALTENYSSVSSSDAKFGKTVLRFADSKNEAQHGAVYYGTSKDGTVYVYTKNGWKLKPTVMKLTDLIQGIPCYGTVQGISKDETGYYNPKK